MNRFTAHTVIAVSALVMAGWAQAADVSAPGHDWSGFYFGGLVGYGGTHSDAGIKYGNDGGDPAVGWVDGEFHGDVYNTLASFVVDDAATSNPAIRNTPMPDLAQWATSLSGDETTVLSTALAGYNFQHDHLILGAELRATFGDFGTSKSWSETSGGSRSGSVDQFGNDFSYVNYGNVLAPTLYTISGDPNPMSYTGNYSQSAKLNARTEFNHLISPVARMGVAVNRLQLFAMGGPSMASVEATTSARIDESLRGSGVLPSSGSGLPPSPTAFTADKTYNFSGSNTETVWGYTIGGGSEWAITDNLILRVEGEYHDLGNVTVKGKSAETDATYKVRQDLDGYTISTGFIWKL